MATVPSGAVVVGSSGGDGFILDGVVLDEVVAVETVETVETVSESVVGAGLAEQLTAISSREANSTAACPSLTFLIAQIPDRVACALSGRSDRRLDLR